MEFTCCVLVVLEGMEFTCCVLAVLEGMEFVCLIFEALESVEGLCRDFPVLEGVELSVLICGPWGCGTAVVGALSCAAMGCEGEHVRGHVHRRAGAALKAVPHQLRNGGGVQG